MPTMIPAWAASDCDPLVAAVDSAPSGFRGVPASLPNATECEVDDFTGEGRLYYSCVWDFGGDSSGARAAYDQMVTLAQQCLASGRTATHKRDSNGRLVAELEVYRGRIPVEVQVSLRRYNGSGQPYVSLRITPRHERASRLTEEERRAVIRSIFQ